MWSVGDERSKEAAQTTAIILYVLLSVHHNLAFIGWTITMYLNVSHSSFNISAAAAAATDDDDSNDDS